MKRILAYISVAVLLGVVMMLAPFTLFVSEIYTQAETSYTLTPKHLQRYPLIPEFDMQRAPLITEQAYGITPATYSRDGLFIAFMLLVSFVIALGVMRYSLEKLLYNI